MPLFDFRCHLGHISEAYIPNHNEAGQTMFQCHCGHLMYYEPSCAGRGLLWAEEGRPRTIWNLGPEPVTVRSLAEHKAAMKKAGVVNAGAPKGGKGRWF